MIASRAAALLALAAAGLAACVGTETGNPSAEGSLAYNTYSSDPRVAALRTADVDDVPLVTAAWLVLGDVSFLPEDDCTEDAAVAINAHGIGAGDHATGEGVTTPLDVAEDRYCGFTLPLMRAEQAPSGAPSELAGRSIVIQGELPDGTRFSVRSGLERELLITGDAPFVLMPDASVLIGFDVATWLSGVDLMAIAPSADGVRVVDDTTPDALAAFESFVPDSIGLFVDPGDHQVDPSTQLTTR